jgi:hypothetical protein
LLLNKNNDTYSTCLSYIVDIHINNISILDVVGIGTLHLRVREWLLFNTRWAIFQLYHGDNKLYSIRWQGCLL